jgi:hypothetical protein
MPLPLLYRNRRLRVTLNPVSIKRKGRYKRVEPAASRFCETIDKWLTLAQRRCAFFENLRQSGRWQRIYSEQSALQAAMQNAVADVLNWAKVLEHAISKEKATGSDIQSDSSLPIAAPNP